MNWSQVLVGKALSASTTSESSPNNGILEVFSHYLIFINNTRKPGDDFRPNSQNN